MGIQLKTDEMLEILQQINHPQYTHAKQAVESAASFAAALVAGHFQTNVSHATFEGIGFAGTCAAFSPKKPDQPCPNIFTEFDDPNAWE